MKVKLLSNIIRNGSTWVEAGVYELVRVFDDSRALIAMRNEAVTQSSQLLTLVPISECIFLGETDE